jgi:hypothetical protein
LESYYALSQHVSRCPFLSFPGLVGSFPDDRDNLRRVVRRPEIDGIASPLVYGRDSVRSVSEACCGFGAERVAAGQFNRPLIPDFFVRLTNGDDGRLVDVRRPDCVDDAVGQFDLTRHVCAEVGWQYAVFTGLDAIIEQNVRWPDGEGTPGLRFAVQAQDDSTALSVFPGPDEGRPNNPCPAPDPTGEHAGIEYAGLPLVLRTLRRSRS